MTQMPLSLIPVPTSYKEGEGSFPLRRDLSIVLSHVAEHGSSAVAVPDHSYVDGGTDNGEGYTLTVEEDRIVVWGASPAGLARGAQTLCQILAQVTDAVPGLRISDAPAFRSRGVMLDVSRCKVPTLATLCRIVDVISSFKLNTLQLYVEDTFAFPSHPDIGREWGALTPEEVVALDTYCRDRYVELVPCLQSTGHMRRILELPAYAHLAESEARWSLALVREESYAMLADLYADHLACFQSSYLNVCSDEAYDLGTGQSRELAEREGKGRLFLGHIKRLHELAAAHGRTIQVWDDMFLYYPELLAELPRDVILLNWWYQALDHYPQVDLVHKAGLRQIVCPGTSSWGTLFPGLDNARANIRAMAADAQRCGALGVLNTDWGDNGHPNLLGNSWYGYAYGAAESWAPGRLDDTTFERSFSRLFFGAEEAPAVLAAMHALNQACELPGLRQSISSRTLAMCFGDPLEEPRWGLTDEEADFVREQLRLHGMPVPDDLEQLRRPFGGPVPAESLASMCALATEALDRLAPLRGAEAEAAQTLDEMRLSARLILHTGAKTQLGRQIADAPDGEDLSHLAPRLTQLKREAHDLRREHERIWLARNKPQGLWQTLDQFAGAFSVLERWGARVMPRYGWGQ
jgi:hypothetical protein